MLFNNEHYKSYLQNATWAFFTDLTTKSLLNALKYMDMNWQDVSISANNDFNNIYNFENAFLELRNHILGHKRIDNKDVVSHGL